MDKLNIEESVWEDTRFRIIAITVFMLNTCFVYIGYFSFSQTVLNVVRYFMDLTPSSFYGLILSTYLLLFIIPATLWLSLLEILIIPIFLRNQMNLDVKLIILKKFLSKLIDVIFIFIGIHISIYTLNNIEPMLKYYNYLNLVRLVSLVLSIPIYVHVSHNIKNQSFVKKIISYN